MATKDKPVDYKLPAKITGALADRLAATRDKRLALQKDVDKLQAEETAIKEHIINLLPKSETSGVAGKFYRVTVVNKSRPQIEDWEKFQPWLTKNKAWDCISHALAPAGIKERWDAGKEVPGVVEFQYPSVSINKV